MKIYQVFKEMLVGVDLLLYNDNTGAEGALKKGYSGSRFMTATASEFWDLAIRYDIAVWVDRVPSAKNIADPPSRGDETFLLNVLKAEKVKPKVGDPAKYWFLRESDARPPKKKKEK